MNYLPFANPPGLAHSIVAGVFFVWNATLSPSVWSQDQPASPPGTQIVQATPTDEAVVTADSANWLEVKPTGANAEFKMPVKPRYVERMFSPIVNQPPIKVRLHIGSFNQKSSAFVFGYHDLQVTPPTQQDIDNTLDGAIVGSIANVQGKPVSQQTIRYGEHPGRAFLYQYAQNNEIYQVSARVFLVGTRQYQISALMKADGFDEKIAASFLDSFRILVPEPESELETKSDTETESDTDSKSESGKELKSESAQPAEQSSESDSPPATPKKSGT